MKALYTGDVPEKPHVLYVGLLCDDGVERTVPVRKARYQSLSTTAKKLAYVVECFEYHHPSGRDGDTRRATRRQVWDNADKAEVEAKFVVVPIEFAGDMVRVSITHHGLTVKATIPNDPAMAEATCRVAFAEYEALVNAQKAALQAFAIER